MSKTVTTEGVGIGWKPERPSSKDYIYSDRHKMRRTASLPSRTRNYPNCQNRRRNQRAEGSCTGHGSAAAAHILTRQDGDRYNTIYSPRFLYNTARLIEQERDRNDALEYDNGAYVRDAMDALRKFGVCPESNWPYKTGDTPGEVERLKHFAKPPSDNRKKQAVRFRVETARADDVDMLLNALAAGHPVVFGFMCHSGMWRPEFDRSGVTPMPGSTDYEDGGHCVCAVDYNLEFTHPSWRGFTGGILAEGSWSDAYANRNPWFDSEPVKLGGFHVLPLEYFRRRWADDAWVAIREAVN